MALYKLVVDKRVRKKDLPKVPPKLRLKIAETIGSLRLNARPEGAIKLTNREEYRLRRGNWRILYVVNDKKRLVEVRTVKHRSGAYKP